MAVVRMTITHCPLCMALAVLSAWRFMAHAAIVWQLLPRPSAELDRPAAAPPLVLRGA